MIVHVSKNPSKITKGMPPSWALSSEEQRRIFRHNLSLGFVWNEDAKKFVSPGEIVRETEQFVFIGKERFLKVDSPRRKSH